MRSSRRISRQLSWQINVTPLVDVMLVLLIVFMVTAPLLSVGIPVHLPKVSAEKVISKQKPIIVTIKDKGQIYLGDKKMTLKELLERVSGMSSPKTAQIFLRADARVSYGAVMNVMGSLNQRGFHSVSLITKDDQKK